MENFVLPKKWCIRGSLELSRWQVFEKNNECNCSLGNNHYFYVNKTSVLDNMSWLFYEIKIPAGYTEITMEQFREHVLKNKKDMNKYTKDYCIENKVVIECENLQEGRKLVEFVGIKSENFYVDSLHGIIYVVLRKNNSFSYQPIGNNLQFKDYFKTQYDYCEKISFSDFMECNSHRRKIYGYKCPYDLFKGRVKKGSIFSAYSNEKIVMYNKDYMTSGVATEIVQTWEPVYEEIKLPVILGNQGFETVSGKIRFGCRNNREGYTKEDYKNFYETLLKFDILSYTINAGEVKIEEVKKIVEYVDAQNG
jgi:hypothetical protein